MDLAYSGLFVIAVWLLATSVVPLCRVVFGFTPTKTVKVLGGGLVYVFAVFVFIAWGQNSRTWMLVCGASAVAVLIATIALAKWAKTKQWPPQRGLFL